MLPNSAGPRGRDRRSASKVPVSRSSGIGAGQKVTPTSGKSGTFLGDVAASIRRDPEPSSRCPSYGRRRSDATDFRWLSTALHRRQSGRRDGRRSMRAPPRQSDLSGRVRSGSPFVRRGRLGDRSSPTQGRIHLRFGGGTDSRRRSRGSRDRSVASVSVRECYLNRQPMFADELGRAGHSGVALPMIAALLRLSPVVNASTSLLSANRARSSRRVISRASVRDRWIRSGASADP
jgi:hypothetical protein